MEKRRPSIFSLYFLIGIIVVVVILITVIVTNSIKNEKKEDISKLDKIDSISGEENIVVDEEGNKSNSSSILLSAREVDGFVFDNFEIVTTSGVSTISFEIYNPSEEDKELGEYELKILDASNNSIGRLTDSTGIIEGKSRREVSLDIKGDIANLTDIKIKKIIYENM